MKISFLAVPLLLMACMTQDPPLQPKPDSLSESWEIWKGLKRDKGGTYAYSARHHSVFGFWTEFEYSITNDAMKTIRVTSGRVDSSGTTSYLLDYDTLEQAQKNWYKTIDAHYRFCQDSVLTLDKAKNDIHELQFLENGILKACTYYPHGCMDDCVMGPRIDAVSF
jgi:hypothetical protein